MALNEFISKTSILTGIPIEDLYCTQNGKKIYSDGDINGDAPLRWAVRLVGGKGGFGSMLRAIGAQIEKTTNREACRDLSGRRLRDIREERRLREWAAQQPQREEEAQKRREERIKRLLAVPKYEFKDEAYEEARRGLEESVDAAVEKGFQVAGPSTSKKTHAPKRKSDMLWDHDLSDVELSDDDSDDDNKSKEESSNESDKSKSDNEVSVAKKPRLSESSTIPIISA